VLEGDIHQGPHGVHEQFLRWLKLPLLGRVFSSTDVLSLVHAFGACKGKDVGGQAIGVAKEAHTAGKRGPVAVEQLGSVAGGEGGAALRGRPANGLRDTREGQKQEDKRQASYKATEAASMRAGAQGKPFLRWLHEVPCTGASPPRTAAQWSVATAPTGGAGIEAS